MNLHTELTGSNVVAPSMPPTRVHRMNDGDVTAPPIAAAEDLVSPKARKAHAKAKPRVFKEGGKADRTRQQLLEAMPAKGEIKARVLAEKAGLKPATAFAHLQALRDQGKVHQVHFGRGAAWALGAGKIKVAVQQPAASKKRGRAAKVDAMRVNIIHVTDKGADWASEPPRFGYWSDGSLHIETPNCKGYLTNAEIVALNAFCKTFEGRT